MLHSVTPRSIAQWENELDLVNSMCSVPEVLLDAHFTNDGLQDILARQTDNQHNISYLTSTSPYAIRYLNDAFVWSEVIKASGFNGSTIAELGPGTSKVVDTALAFLGYSGSLLKVDYTEWRELENDPLQWDFTISSHAFDVVREIDKLPLTDMVLMNHFVDDLFIGLWATANNVDYFGFAINKIEENEKCWQRAMKEAVPIIDQVLAFFDALALRVNEGGRIILKSYPSGFETHFSQIDRINFTFDLTNRIVEQLRQNGYTDIPIDLEAIPGASGSKYPGSFSALRLG